MVVGAIAATQGCGLGSLDGLMDGRPDAGRDGASDARSPGDVAGDQDRGDGSEAGGTTGSGGAIGTDSSDVDGTPEGGGAGGADAGDGATDAEVGATADAEAGDMGGSCDAGSGVPRAPFVGPTGVQFAGGAAQIEAEYYDIGGEGISYHDSTPCNIFGAFRSGPNEGVDVETRCGTFSCYDVGEITPGEWMEYTINVLTPGTYLVQLGAAAIGTAHMHVDLDGASATGSIEVRNTSSLYYFVAQPTGIGIGLSAGQHVLRFTFDDGIMALNWVRFTM
jgi:hypothetical protein